MVIESRVTNIILTHSTGEEDTHHHVSDFICSEPRVEVGFIVKPEAVGPLSPENRVQVRHINDVYYIDEQTQMKYFTTISERDHNQ